MTKKRIITAIIILLTTAALTACSTANENGSSSTGSTASVTAEQSVAGTATGTVTSSTSQEITDAGIDASELFTDRDLKQSVDTSDALVIEVSDDKVYTISEEGIYVITGTAKNCTIKVDADSEDKVQLVLDGVSITNDSTPAIYVVSADKCFITTTDSENSLTVTGSFTADGDTNTDAVIFSKDDLVFNGTGTLTIVSNYGNGISGKDDVKFTGGTYNIKSAEDGVEANDSIAVYDGSFTVVTNKDAFHSENDEDYTLGYIYIGNGTFNINAADDGIQGTTFVRIDGGSFNITAAEAIEATYIVINDGTFNIQASDDGINASYKSKMYSVPEIVINGGDITIVMGSGDTDAIDSNGNIYINGGTIDITAQVSSFDCDGTAEFNGGTLIINGSEVDSIPNSMMGGMGGFGNMGGSFGGNTGGQKGGFGGRR